MSLCVPKVQKVLVMLDLTDAQNVCADALSGGQKRKLSLGIAVLGNPQVGTGRVCAHATCVVLGHSFAFLLGTETVVIFPCHALTNSLIGRTGESGSIRAMSLIRRVVIL